MERECCSFKKYFAEMIGTMTLVLFGCGVAVYTGGSVVPTAFAFGLSLIAMSFVVGQVSGCHLNPAVSLALFINKRLSFKDLIGYMLAQFIGATVACLELMMLFGRDQSYGANVMQNAITSTHGDAAAIVVAIVAEIIMTFVFVVSLLGVTAKTENKGFIGIVCGLTLTLVHLLGLGVTGTSVNPARSLFPAFFAGGDALRQCWIFVVGPFVGAILAALCFTVLDNTPKREAEERYSA